MEDAGEDPTIFSAHSLPSDPRLLATVTNAYLGTRVYHDTLHVSGVYNGACGDTHRAILPSPLNVKLEVPAGTGEQLTKTFTLDTNTGSFLHTLEGPRFRASQRIYAHRTLPHVLAFSVSITRLAAGSWPVTVLLQSAFSPESPDLDLHLGPDFQGARYAYGRTLTSEQPGGSQQEVHMLWSPVPPALTLREGEDVGTWEFLTVVGGSQAEAQACLADALHLQARGTLYTAHAQAWAQLWADCGLDVVGPLPLRQALRGALYYLLSALPQPGAPHYVCHGLSPGGLSNGSHEECYWGHVFWDQDLWMLPNILMFHPEAARALLEYRIRTLGGALDNARDLGFQDLQLFREAGGWDVVSAVAQFWCSRVEWNPGDEKYHLKGVMPPDEYHSGVDNSVYTNVLVQNSLHFAAALAQDLGRPIPDQWLVVADKIKVPFDPKLNFHPEFDGYQPGEEVKQADVVLLGYPVPFPLSPQVRKKNLEFYEPVTSPQGPAMTWSMFAVGWLELKDARRAWDLLEKSFPNISEPFKVSLAPASTCTLTAPSSCMTALPPAGVDGECRRVGGRELLNGHGGLPASGTVWVHGVQVSAVASGGQSSAATCSLHRSFPSPRITQAGLAFDPTCPAGVSGVYVAGISYQGSKLDFSFSEGSVTVEVMARSGPWAPPLEAELWPSQARLPLPPGHKISFPCSAGRIQRSCL
ncbi:protein-glucosylgalactosylhydroxylysine glucosidase isoform X2 [Vicugna pacos]|uniref:Protein-glucosylgalactosylhydroxylysine glucosidase isoform X2 n=1 Tax=Vicugna pacos TaxID=30538 RepID=A0ABM5E0V7_VICPA